MKRYGKRLRNATSVLAALSTGFLAFNMLGILIFKQQVFFERGALARVEIVILIGFVLVLLFDVVSLLWSLQRLHESKQAGIGDKAIAALGALCLLLLMGEKVMVDEIGRESLLGWEVLGEWIILYTFLVIQLIYNLIILSKLPRTYRDRPSLADNGL